MTTFPDIVEVTADAFPHCVGAVDHTQMSGHTNIHAQVLKIVKSFQGPSNRLQQVLHKDKPWVEKQISTQIPTPCDETIYHVIIEICLFFQMILFCLLHCAVNHMAPQGRVWTMFTHTKSMKAGNLHEVNTEQKTILSKVRHRLVPTTDVNKTNLFYHLCKNHVKQYRHSLWMTTNKV